MLPIRTSIRPGRTPYANYALIIANAILFIVTYHPHMNRFTGQGETLRESMKYLMLYPEAPRLWQFITYAFLHGGYLHIFGNMYFLYIFGNNVNDKLGNAGYLIFYFAGAIFGAIGYVLFNTNPILGASGAVAAVTGAYLALFPQTLITVLYWFIFIGTIELPAIYFIAIKLILIDQIIVANTPNVAYDAHLAGYGFGVLSAILLLATGLTSRSGFDMWSMLKQWNRRRAYRDLVSNDFDPFKNPTKAIKVKEIKKTPQQIEKEEKIVQLRYQISNSINEHKISQAIEYYLDLMKIDETQIIPRQHLLDVANQLASENKYEESAIAYEKFLIHYENYEYVEQIELMLGLIYSRYLDQPERAIQHLQAAEKKLTDAGQKKMCEDELKKLTY